MQKMKFSARLISLILTLSILVSAFSVFAFATDATEDDTASDTLNVAYNRTFDEGWDYDNGIKADFLRDNKVGISYELVGAAYNHYLRLEKTNTNAPAYLFIDTASLDKTGKTFIELDLASSLENGMGQAVRVNVGGSMKTLIEFKADGMYILGTNVGHIDYAMKWEKISFVFDFDYADTIIDAADDEYSVTAYKNSEIVASAVWKRGGGGFGVSQIRFAYGNVLSANVGQWYAIDNLKVYSGVDEFTAMTAKEYGSAVDADATKDYPLASTATGPDGFLTGAPMLERTELPSGAVNHFNRHYGEGYSLDNYYNSTDKLRLISGDHNFDIKSEKLTSGERNYFMRVRAITGKSGFLEVPVVQSPDFGRLVMEFDIKAGVNADIGDIISYYGTTGEKYIVSIVDGQLVLFGNSVGYIGNDWVHIVFAFDYEKADDGKKYCTVYYGNAGYFQAQFNSSELMISYFHIGVGANPDGEYDSYGDWYGLDNLQIYSGLHGFATLPEDDHGLGVYPDHPQDFPLIDAELPEVPLAPGGAEDVLDRVPNVPSGGYPGYVTGSPAIERVDIDENTWVQYHRTYSEGWSFGVGGGTNASAIMTLENEQQLDLTYNYFQRYEASTTKNAYWTLNTSGQCPTAGKVFLEMDVRAVTGADFGGAFQLQHTSGASGKYLFGFGDEGDTNKDGVDQAGYLMILGKPVCKVTEDEWVHLAFEIDFDYALNTPGANANEYLISAYIGDSLYMEEVLVGKDGATKFGYKGFRIGFESAQEVCFGQFWDMDNLALYAGTSTFANIPDDNYGNLINPTTPKDFPIQSTTISLNDMIADSLFLKVGSDYTLNRNERVPALENEETGAPYGAPVNINGTVWVPLDTILNFLSYPLYAHEDGQSFDISTGSTITYLTLGRDTASVAGRTVKLTAAPAIIPAQSGEFLAVAVDDVKTLFPGFYCKLDDMNLITFSQHAGIVEGEISQDLRIDIMTDFIFEFFEAEDVYERVKENTNNFDHPYLRGNQAQFDELHEVWMAGQAALTDPTIEYDETLYSYINAIVRSGRSSYNRYSNIQMEEIVPYGTEEYAGLRPECYIYDSVQSGSYGLQHPYPASNGYDPYGGRLNPPFDHFVPLSYAYLVTRDDRFALLCYDYAFELCNWKHWGPGHFLNAADTASAIANAYDWCYDAWVRLGLDTDAIADGIYYHGALQGYLVTIGQPDPHGRAGGNGSTYWSMSNNWNAVCTAGVAMAAMAVMDYTGLDEDTKIVAARHAAKEYGGTNIQDVLTYVVASNYKTLIKYGLGMYAPDGSYEESVSYWSYGAGNVFLYSQILESTMGSHMGIMDTWGLDRTCRSILHMVSSDFVKFAYNDTSPGGGCSSGYFNYVAHAIDDDFLRIVRRMHIASFDVARTVNDSLYYKNVDDLEDVELELQYHHVGIHGYTTRSSWDRGAIFAGLLGGDNDDGHGHIDAGQWVYYNKNIVYFEDIGADGYNTYNYFSNNNMYKTNPEGHNVILVTSMQDKMNAGQLRNSVSPVIRVFDNEHGSLATVDTTPAFGTAFLKANRGLLLTNDRKTVVIQDEIMPDGNQTFWWLAHYNNTKITAEIAEGGRTAYMTGRSTIDGKEYVLRVQMISPIRRGISFAIMGTGQVGINAEQDYLLDATMRPGDSEAHGKQPEGDRSMYSKLAVKFENLTTMQFSVVLEVIDRDAPIDVGYTFTEMANWVPYADTREKAETITPDDTVVEETGKRTSAKITEMRNITRVQRIEESGVSLFLDLETFYSAITTATYIVNQNGRDKIADNKSVAQYLELYDRYYAIYDAYVTDVRQTTDHVTAIANLMIGA